MHQALLHQFHVHSILFNYSGCLHINNQIHSANRNVPGMYGVSSSTKASHAENRFIHMRKKKYLAFAKITHKNCPLQMCRCKNHLIKWHKLQQQHLCVPKSNNPLNINTGKVLIQLIWLGQELQQKREKRERERAWWIGVRVNKRDR